MKEIPRYNQIQDGDQLTEATFGGIWCKWADVKAAFKEQLPEGMEECIIQFKECEQCQRGRLTAANWIDHGCPHCERDKLQKELQEVRAQAIAAMYLVPEGENIGNLRKLAKEALDVLMGKDKATIAALQDELFNVRESHAAALRCIQRGPGVNAVYGINRADKAQLRYVLMLTSVRHGSNGGLEIEVQLP